MNKALGNAGGFFFSKTWYIIYEKREQVIYT